MISPVECDRPGNGIIMAVWMAVYRHSAAFHASVS
jgi:hypothetical protein